MARSVDMEIRRADSAARRFFGLLRAEAGKLGHASEVSVWRYMRSGYRDHGSLAAHFAEDEDADTVGAFFARLPEIQQKIFSSKYLYPETSPYQRARRFSLSVTRYHEKHRMLLTRLDQELVVLDERKDAA